MNLENLNLVELNAQETQETEGGHPVVWILEGLAVLATAAMLRHERGCWRCQNGDRPIYGPQVGPGGRYA